jgi:hypothetical protein
MPAGGKAPMRSFTPARRPAGNLYRQINNPDTIAPIYISFHLYNMDFFTLSINLFSRKLGGKRYLSGLRPHSSIHAALSPSSKSSACTRWAGHLEKELNLRKGLSDQPIGTTSQNGLYRFPGHQSRGLSAEIWRKTQKTCKQRPHRPLPRRLLSLRCPILRCLIDRARHGSSCIARLYPLVLKWIILHPEAL